MESSAFWPRPPKPVPDEEEVLGKSIGVAPPIAEDQTAEVAPLTMCLLKPQQLCM